jgi:hypothetical protein
MKLKAEERERFHKGNSFKNQPNTAMQNAADFLLTMRMINMQIPYYKNP